MRHVRDARYGLVVLLGAHRAGGAAQRLPKAGKACEKLCRGAGRWGEGNCGVVQQVCPGVLQPLFLAAGHGVRADEAGACLFDDAAGRLVNGGFHGAYIGDEGAGAESRQDAACEIGKGAYGSGENGELGPAHGILRIAEGVGGDAEAARLLQRLAAPGPQAQVAAGHELLHSHGDGAAQEPRAQHGHRAEGEGLGLLRAHGTMNWKLVPRTFSFLPLG